MVDTTSFLLATLPPHVRPLQVRRDFILLDILINVLRSQRVGILLDSDYDLRIVSVLSCLVVIDRNACATLIALAERQGRVTSYWAGQPPPFIASYQISLLQDALKQAADAALFNDDVWDIEAPQFVDVLPDGKLNYDALPADHPLRIIPARVPPGRVTP